jgi:Flp pilus assembly protein TadG
MNTSFASRINPGRSRSIRTRIQQLLHSGDRGSAIVEMALAMPIMMFILTGVFTFSNALYEQLSLAEGISVGGRTLAVDRGDTDPCKTATAAIKAAAPSLNNSNLTLTYTLNGVLQGVGTTSCTGGAVNLVASGSATIRATYSCNLGLFGHAFGTCTIKNQVTEVVQ